MRQYTVNLHLTPEMRQMSVYHLCYCLQSIIIVVTQKLVLQQSKNFRAKSTETLSPPPSIQFSLVLYNLLGPDILVQTSTLVYHAVRECFCPTFIARNIGASCPDYMSGG